MDAAGGGVMSFAVMTLPLVMSYLTGDSSCFFRNSIMY